MCVNSNNLSITSRNSVSFHLFGVFVFKQTNYPFLFKLNINDTQPARSKKKKSLTARIWIHGFQIHELSTKFVDFETLFFCIL
jgi:hypothetical protein